MEHPLQTAITLAELQLDANSWQPRCCTISRRIALTISDIEAKFGAEVAKLVDGVTKLGKVPLTTGTIPPATHVENLRKMLVAMAEDLRVVFIKLATGCTTCARYPPCRGKTAANRPETLEIYAPLAHRLGIWELNGSWKTSPSATWSREYHRIAR